MKTQYLQVASDFELFFLKKKHKNIFYLYLMY